MAYSRYVFLNPFRDFQWGSSVAILKTSALVQFLCIVSLCVALGSVSYTFPIMHDVIQSQSSKVARFLVDLLLPYIVILLQVTVLFVPALYAWRWGKLEVVALPEGRGEALATRCGRHRHSC